MFREKTKCKSHFYQVCFNSFLIEYSVQCCYDSLSLQGGRDDTQTAEALSHPLPHCLLCQRKTARQPVETELRTSPSVLLRHAGIFLCFSLSLFHLSCQEMQLCEDKWTDNEQNSPKTLPADIFIYIIWLSDCLWNALPA